MLRPDLQTAEVRRRLRSRLCMNSALPEYTERIAARKAMPQTRREAGHEGNKGYKKVRHQNRTILLSCHEFVRFALQLLLLYGWCILLEDVSDNCRYCYDCDCDCHDITSCMYIL